MTKWEFQQIIMRDKLRLEHKDHVGHDWLVPLLLLEVEEDRHELILFCGKLGKQLRETHEKLPA